MAQTVTEIKKIMTDKFISNESVIARYELDTSKTFEEQFSTVSIESIMFYVFAFCVWTLQMLWDTNKAEIKIMIDNQKAHTPKWYRDKALAFRFGRNLMLDDDVYDLTGIDLQTISSELVVKFAAAVEYQGRLYIKVAGGTATAKARLSDDIETALNEYFTEIRDAGIVIGNDADKKTTVTNKNADHFACKYDIYYNPMVFDANGIRLSDSVSIVSDTIKDFVQNKINFNGEYRNDLLTDALQKIDGVVIPELQQTSFISDDDFNADGDWSVISAKCIPISGYFKVYEDTDLVLNYIAYQTANE